MLIRWIRLKYIWISNIFIAQNEEKKNVGAFPGVQSIYFKFSSKSAYPLIIFIRMPKKMMFSVNFFPCLNTAHIMTIETNAWTRKPNQKLSKKWKIFFKNQPKRKSCHFQVDEDLNLVHQLRFVPMNEHWTRVLYHFPIYETIWDFELFFSGFLWYKNSHSVPNSNLSNFVCILKYKILCHIPRPKQFN